MFRLIKYIFNTVTTEIKEDIQIVKYIVESHVQTIKEEI